MHLRTILGSLALAVAALPAMAAGPYRIDRDDLRVRQLPRTLVAKLEALDFYGREEALNMRFSLTNRSSKSVWVLRWQLPGADMDAPVFQVTRDGEPVPYLGPLVKRAQPDASDYLEIKPGATHSVVFDPSAHYDMSLQGDYEVAYTERTFGVRHLAPEQLSEEVESSMLFDRGSLNARRLDTEPQDAVQLGSTATVRFAFAGAPEASRRAEELMGIGGYTKCTTSQTSNLQTAHANASLIAGLAISHLNTNPDNRASYTYWFGTYSSGNYSKVTGNYTKVKDAFDNKSVTYDCGCKKSAYAYVYPSQPYKIYLCKAFWSAPALGRDSKAGTLVHEMTHFSVVAGTQDYVYGATGAHSLALSDPSKAIANADNHEYFAEDRKMK